MDPLPSVQPVATPSTIVEPAPSLPTTTVVVPTTTITNTTTNTTNNPQPFVTPVTTTATTVAVATPTNQQGQSVPQFVERSPQGNYIKFPEILGKGAFKTVFRGQDVNNGYFIAWNEVAINRYTKKEKDRIMYEVKLLRTLSHPNLISFYGAWVNKEAEKVVFITELMSSGTLRDFCNKYPISLKQIKRYCKEILECISYLHTPIVANEEENSTVNTDADKNTGTAASSGTSTVPKPSTATVSSTKLKDRVIHRDLKCDNIFIMNQGKGIKIGDLGLATTDGRSILGTPEFMAPEMYDTGYSTSVDIYAFGLCLLEMVTGRTPYCECTSVVQVYKKVLAGILPENIRILEHGWPEAYAFLLRCLVPLPNPASSTTTNTVSVASTGTSTETNGGNTNTHGTNGNTSSTNPIGNAAGNDDEDDDEDANNTINATNKTNNTVPLTTTGTNDGSVPNNPAAQPTTNNTNNPTVKKTKQKVTIVRPTAADLLQDPFLQPSPEDSVRNTADVRKLAERKGFYVITGHDDVHRRLDLPPLQLPSPEVVAQLTNAVQSNALNANAVTIAPSTTNIPTTINIATTASTVTATSAATVMNASVSANSDVSVASVSNTTTNNEKMNAATMKNKNIATATTTDNSTTTIATVPAPKMNDSVGTSRSSNRNGTAVTAGTSAVSLNALAEEVRALRYTVMQTNKLVEWLVSRTDEGKKMLAERTQLSSSSNKGKSTTTSSSGTTGLSQRLSSSPRKTSSNDNTAKENPNNTIANVVGHANRRTRSGDSPPPSLSASTYRTRSSRSPPTNDNSNSKNQAPLVANNPFQNNENASDSVSTGNVTPSNQSSNNNSVGRRSKTKSVSFAELPDVFTNSSNSGKDSSGASNTNGDFVTNLTGSLTNFSNSNSTHPPLKLLNTSATVTESAPSSPPSPPSPTSVSSVQFNSNGLNNNSASTSSLSSASFGLSNHLNNSTSSLVSLRSTPPTSPSETSVPSSSHSASYSHSHLHPHHHNSSSLSSISDNLSVNSSLSISSLPSLNQPHSNTNNSTNSSRSKSIEEILLEYETTNEWEATTVENSTNEDTVNTIDTTHSVSAMTNSSNGATNSSQSSSFSSFVSSVPTYTNPPLINNSSHNDLSTVSMNDTFLSTIPEDLQIDLNNIRNNYRIQEYKIAKMASKQLLEITELRKTSDQEHKETIEAELLRHATEKEKFDRSHQEIMKILGPLRQKRERLESSNDTSIGLSLENSTEDEGTSTTTVSASVASNSSENPSSALTVREKAEEQLYARRLELLEARVKDEMEKHKNIMEKAEDVHDHRTKRFIQREKEIRESFAVRNEKYRTDMLSMIEEKKRAWKTSMTGGSNNGSSVVTALPSNTVSATSPIHDIIDATNKGASSIMPNTYATNTLPSFTSTVPSFVSTNTPAASMTAGSSANTSPPLGAQRSNTDTIETIPVLALSSALNGLNNLPPNTNTTNTSNNGQLNPATNTSTVNNNTATTIVGGSSSSNGNNLVSASPHLLHFHTPLSTGYGTNTNTVNTTTVSPLPPSATTSNAPVLWLDFVDGNTTNNNNNNNTSTATNTMNNGTTILPNPTAVSGIVSSTNILSTLTPTVLTSSSNEHQGNDTNNNNNTSPTPLVSILTTTGTAV